MTTVLAIIIPIVALILIIGVWRDLTKPKKIAPKDQASINAMRYSNYGHNFDIMKYLDAQKGKNTAPDTILSYSIKKSTNGVWCIFLYLTSIYDKKKQSWSSVNLEYPYQEQYKYSYYYDNNKKVRATCPDIVQKPEDFLKDEIDKKVKAVIDKYTREYPFNFAEEERDGVL